MSKKLKLFGLALTLLLGLQATAAVPSGYYNNAQGKSDRALKTALHTIIKGHTKRSYDNLWTDFKTTDCVNNIIIDRYSTTQYTYNTDKCGTYNSVGDCYNREHSIPNSWWGGSSSDTAYTDLHHMFPVDGWVNNERGNNPFGNCANGTPKGTGKLGTCTFSGYSGTVFEVADEYKGDFARVYFYFATRYMMRMSDFTKGTGSVVFTSGNYLGLTTWAINQLLEWHRNDPVSTLETNRNNAVYNIQHNRNPFVDYPELVEYIWGNLKGNAWTPGGSATTPVLTSPVNGSTVNVGTNTGSGVSKSITVKGSNLTKALTVSVSGTGFSVTPTTITASNANNGTTVTVTYNGTATSATGTLTISSSELSTTTVSLTASYNSGGTVEPGDEIIETWEGISTYQSYSTTFIQGHAFKWNTSDVGIWSGDSHANGTQSVRFGKTAASYIAMAEDVTDGASKISFYAANWSSNEATPTIQVQYSSNGGSTWTTVGSCSPNTTWKQYSFDLNVTGNVRFKIVQTAGARLNIDDIAITSNSGTPVTNPQITAPVNGSTVDVGTIAPTGTSVSKTITVKGSDLSMPLAVSVSGNGFSVTPATISAANANAGTSVTVTYSSSNPGNATGTLLISSGEVSVTVNLTAAKAVMPYIAFSGIGEVTAEQDGVSTVESSSVSSENNTENITLTVEGNFELSLNRNTWAKTLTLDPSGETFYVRLQDTSTPGDYDGHISATTSLAHAYIDIWGTVYAKQVQYGDVNKDGHVSISDITALIDYLLGSEVSPFDGVAADVNQDGNISISDVTALIDILLAGPSSVMKQERWDAVPDEHGIVVFNPMGEELEVYDFDANCVATVTSAGESVVSLPAGIYVVADEMMSRKVVVK